MKIAEIHSEGVQAYFYLTQSVSWLLIAWVGWGFNPGGGGGTRSEKWWGCATGRWKLDPKRSREKWNLGPKRSNSVRIGSFNTPKDRFGVGGWEKIPQKDRARSCQSEKRGSKPRHICITHHIGSTPPRGFNTHCQLLKLSLGVVVNSWMV